MKSTSVDAVVIGSGAFGASAAFHLARAGRRVVVVDRSELTDQTSPRAAGLTMQIHDHEPLARVAMCSVEQMTSFAADTGQPLTVHQVGSTKIGRTEEAAWYAKRHEDAGSSLAEHSRP